MHSLEEAASRPYRSRLWSLLPWAGLLPLIYLLRPYHGLIQDARIYLGRGVADLDPGHIGHDLLFADDRQTEFSIMRLVVHGLLGVMPAGEASMLIVATGLLVWIVAAIALARSLATGRVAWAVAVGMLALPPQYGALGVFSYAQAIATPRVFAEAAVLGALAALLCGRRIPAAGLLVVAAAFHPLMSLPGIAVAAVLLVWEDRRWLFAIAAGLVVLVVSALLGLPLAGRLFQTVDPEWLAILHLRSLYLFPTLWPLEAYGLASCQFAALVIAGSVSPPRLRTLLWGTAGIAAAGVVVTAAFGDLVPSVLVAQIQLWRATWLLSLFGNGALALCAAGLWRRGSTARLTLALLVMAWFAPDVPAVAIALSVASVALRVADLRGAVPSVARGVVVAGGVGVGVLGLCLLVSDLHALAVLVRATWVQGGEESWSFVVSSGSLIVPLAGAALALAVTRSRRGAPSRRARLAGLAAVALGCIAAVFVWDGRSTERRMIDVPGGSPGLQAALAPAAGEVLWLDDDGQAWFLAGRAAYFSAMQAAPILFSRDLAVTWYHRAKVLEALGFLRAGDVSPWDAPPDEVVEIPLTPAGIEGLCRDPGHPAALVAPGDQTARVPNNYPAWLWRPPSPLRRLSIDESGIRWRTIPVFTAVLCAPSAARDGRQPPRLRASSQRFEWVRPD